MTCLLVFSTIGAGESGHHDWQFADSVNPATPTVSSNTARIANAEISVGYLSSGWFASLQGLGNEYGFWDLGFQNPDQPGLDTRGWIVLNVPNLGFGTGSNPTDLVLRVVQFVDGFIYRGNLTLSPNFGQYMGRTVVESLPGSLGGDWVEDEYQWRFAPGLEQLSLSITGAVNGTLIGRIRVDTVRPATIEPEMLVITSIEKRNQALAITWAGGRPPYGIYASSNLMSFGSWQQVGPLISGTNAEVPLSGPVGFITVRGSD
jgi:hypothetical protein